MPLIYSKKQFSACIEEILEGSLPSNCLLSLVIAQPGGAIEYAPPVAGPAQSVTERAEIRISVDKPGKRVVFAHWGEIKGVNAQLLIILAASYQDAVRNECAPEKFPFISASRLSSEINCEEETLRKRVYRCRNQIAQMASMAGDLTPDDGAVIENVPWHGYRLNPDRVRIIAMSDLSSAEWSRFSGNQVTSRPRPIIRSKT